MPKCGCMECDCNTIHNENVKKAKRQMLDNATLLKIANFYKALADSTRIKIVNALDKCPLCVCDISAILNMTKSAVSHQLQYLKEMGLIKGDRRGKEVIYSLADEHVLQIFEICLQHVLEAQ